MSERREGWPQEPSDKRCLAYCGDERCDCELSPRYWRHTLPPAAPPGLDEAAMVEAVWLAARERCASPKHEHIDDVKRLIMVSKEDVAAIVKAALRPLLAQREAEAWRKASTMTRAALALMLKNGLPAFDGVADDLRAEAIGLWLLDRPLPPPPAHEPVP